MKNPLVHAPATTAASAKPPAATLGERVEAERLARNWTQQKLADEVKRHGGSISQSSVDKLEKRRSKKSTSSVYLARALGINHDWLITGKGPRAGLSSVDAKLQLLPQDDIDDLYDDFAAIIDRRLEKRNIRQ